MRVVLVSDRYGSFTGFPAWTLELRFHGPLRPGYERQHRYLAVWGLSLMAIWKTESVAIKARPTSRSSKNGRQEPLTPEPIHR